MNQLPEEALLEQRKNLLKSSIECLINSSKATIINSIEQQYDNLKVTIFQRIESFYNHSSQRQRAIYESPPESDRHVPSDNENNVVPLNLSSKCKVEEEVERPIDLYSCRLSEQGQAARQNIACDTHQAVQQNDLSKSSAIRTTQSSVESFHMVSQSEKSTPATSVQQINSLQIPLTTKSNVVSNLESQSNQSIVKSEYDDGIHQFSSATFALQLTNSSEKNSSFMPTNLLPQANESLTQINSETLKNIPTPVAPPSTPTVSAPESTELSIPESNRPEIPFASTNQQKSNTNDDKSDNSKATKKSKSEVKSSRTSHCSSTKDSSSNSQSRERYRSRSRSRGSSSKESKSSRKRTRSRSSERYRSRSRRSSSRESLNYSATRQNYSTSAHYNAPKSFHRFLIKCLICPMPNCSMELPNQMKLNIHLSEIHNLPLPYECPLDGCGLHFRTADNLFQHVNSQHRFVSNWTCRKCLMKFLKGCDLLNHTYYEHILGKYQCSVEGCNFIAPFKNKIYTHFFTHYDSHGTLRKGLLILPEAIKQQSERRWEDEWQPKSYSKKSEKTVTLEENQHKFTITTLLCPVKYCDFECFYKGDDYEMQKHNLEIHKIKFYPCSAPNCDESFNFRDELILHVAQKHTKTVWRCNECPFEASNNIELDEHSVLFHNSGIFKCSHKPCIFSSSNRIQVIKHYDKIHASQR